MVIYCFGRQIGLNLLETEARIYLRTGCIRYTLYDSRDRGGNLYLAFFNSVIIFKLRDPDFVLDDHSEDLFLASGFVIQTSTSEFLLP